MALDNSIALNIRPVESEPYAIAQQRALTLRNLAQQSAQQHTLGQQAISEGDLKLASQRLAMSDEADTREIFKNSYGVPAGGGQIVAPPVPGVPQGAGVTMNDQNVAQIVQQLRAKGLHTQADAVVDHYNKQQQTKATASMDLSHGALFDTQALEKKHAMVGQELDAIDGMAPDKRPAAYTASVLKLEAAGLLKPGEEPHEYPGDDQFHRIRDSFLAHQDKIAAAKDARDAEEAKAKLPGIQAESAQKAIVADQFQNLGMSKKDADELARHAAANAETSRHNKKDEGIAGGRLAVEQRRFNATLGAGLDANGQPLPVDAAKAAAMADPAAVAMAKYQLPPPPARSALGQAMLRKVLAIDPTYDGTQFQARNKTAQDFSASGASGKAITSADTALAHLDTLSKAGAALKSSNIQVLNQMANAVGAQAGSSPQTVYDSIVSMVAPEISKAVIGAAGGEGERGGMALNFGSKLSNAQREGNIGAAAGLLGARVHKQAQAYESTMGRPLDRKLSPESQAVLDRYTKPAAAGGAPPAMPATLSTSDVGKTYTNSAGKKIKITAVNPSNPKQFQGSEVQ
jgi:hypothetical protein